MADRDQPRGTESTQGPKAQEVDYSEVLQLMRMMALKPIEVRRALMYFHAGDPHRGAAMAVYKEITGKEAPSLPAAFDFIFGNPDTSQQGNEAAQLKVAANIAKRRQRDAKQRSHKARLEARQNQLPPA